MAVLLVTHDRTLLSETRARESSSSIRGGSCATRRTGRRLMAYTSREAFFAFRRSPLLTALSIATIAFALYTLSVFGLVWTNIDRVLESVEERVEVIAYLVDGTDPSETSALMREVAAYPRSTRSPTSPRRTRSSGPAPSSRITASCTRTWKPIRCRRPSRSRSGPGTETRWKCATWRRGSPASRSSRRSNTARTGCRSSISCRTCRCSWGSSWGACSRSSRSWRSGRRSTSC